MTSGSIKRVLRHYEQSHLERFRITCGIQDCQVPFTSAVSYRRHVRKKHSCVYDPPRIIDDHPVEPGDNSSADQELIDTSDEYNDTSHDQVHAELHSDTESCKDTSSSDEEDIDYNEIVSDILLSAREEHKMTTAATQFMCNEFQKLTNHNWNTHNANLNKFLRNDLNESDKIELEAIQENNTLAVALEKFSQEKSLDRFIQDKETFVMPVEIVLGVNEKGKRDTFQYIPILQTLDAFLRHEDVLAEVLRTRPNTDIIESIRDGSHVKESAFLSRRDTLLINLYNDEFTISNPLGNKTKKYKILAFYFSLGNLSPRLNSRLKSIQLAIVAKHVDAKRYGASAILAPLIEDLKELENKGIRIKFYQNCHLFFGSVSLVISDNLAAHWLFGFQESFSKTKRVCRFCMCLRDDMGTCTNADQCESRTEEAHGRHLKGIAVNRALVKEYGVKDDCPLNELQNFHCTSGFPSDVAHDLFEGVCFNIMSAVIIHFVEKGVFTLEELNDKIEHFSYKRCDRRDKPQPFTIPAALNAFKVKLTAIESWNFCRLFPLMFGCMVDEDDDFWELLLNLLDYLDEVMTMRFDLGSTYYLDELFDELMSLYHAFARRSQTENAFLRALRGSDSKIRPSENKIYP